MSNPPPLAQCFRCGSPLSSPDALVCPVCGALLHAPQLEKLSAEARWQEQFNPDRAIFLWSACLKLLPPESRQYATIQSEIVRLQSLPKIVVRPPEPGAFNPAPRQESWPMAILKTGGSMLLSIVVYQSIFGWQIAIGFVGLILIHEMGHIVADLVYGITVSPPIFIPFVGAVIWIRQQLPNARVEALISIAGPLAGTIGSLAMLAWYFATGSQIPLVLSWFGFTMNLFNMLPVPPLDGGRVAAAISPWVWVLGLAGLAYMVVEDLRSHGSPGILIYVLIVALPRIIATLKRGGRDTPYYRISPAWRLLIGVCYLALLGTLIGLRMYTQQHLPGGGMF